MAKQPEQILIDLLADEVLELKKRVGAERLSRFATKVDLDASTGMKDGDLAYVTADKVWYSYDLANTKWEKQENVKNKLKNGGTLDDTVPHAVVGGELEEIQEALSNLPELKRESIMQSWELTHGKVTEIKTGKLPNMSDLIGFVKNNGLVEYRVHENGHITVPEQLLEDKYFKGLSSVPKDSSNLGDFKGSVLMLNHSKTGMAFMIIDGTPKPIITPKDWAKITPVLPAEAGTSIWGPTYELTTGGEFTFKGEVYPVGSKVLVKVRKDALTSYNSYAAYITLKSFVKTGLVDKTYILHADGKWYLNGVVSTFTPPTTLDSNHSVKISTYDFFKHPVNIEEIIVMKSRLDKLEEVPPLVDALMEKTPMHWHMTKLESGLVSSHIGQLKEGMLMHKLIYSAGAPVTKSMLWDKLTVTTINGKYKDLLLKYNGNTDKFLKDDSLKPPYYYREWTKGTYDIQKIDLLDMDFLNDDAWHDFSAATTLTTFPMSIGLSAAPTFTKEDETQVLDKYTRLRIHGGKLQIQRTRPLLVYVGDGLKDVEVRSGIRPTVVEKTTPDKAIAIAKMADEKAFLNSVDYTYFAGKLIMHVPNIESLQHSGQSTEIIEVGVAGTFASIGGVITDINGETLSPSKSISIIGVEQ